MAGVGKRTYLRDVNPYLICPLCRGYLIDATTVVECLHSFCRSCILKHLNTEAHCPSCKHVLNKAKPNIKADKALQDIVYKLVPGLYHKEMRKRREFYKKHPEHADFATPEQRGEDVSGRLIFAPEDAVSLSLEYLPPGADPLNILLTTSDDSTNTNSLNTNGNMNNNNQNNSNNRRYLQCPALVAIAHLKKFLALKYSVDMTRYSIEICHRRAPLPEHWTLMDVAYIYAWKRNAPMRFFYRVTLEEQRLEAPPHERPSTPGLGASLPPTDAAITIKQDTNPKDIDTEPESKPEIKNKEAVLPECHSEVPKVHRNPTNLKASLEKQENSVSKMDTDQQTSTVVTSSVTTSTTSVTTSAVTSSTTTTTTVNTVTSPSSDSTKQIKTPIKILKNSDGRYEVLRSPSDGWNTKEQGSNPAEVKPTSPEFSVVSIGNGQNSNGVKITLKQCSPTNSSPNKPKVISNVLLHCGQMDKETSGVLVLQQLQREREKQQAEKQLAEKQLAEKQLAEKQLAEKQLAEKQLAEKQLAEKQLAEKQLAEKQEKQKRRVTFMDGPITEKPVNNVQKTSLMKKPGEQEKKQFLQSFQLTAKEWETDSPISELGPKSKTKENNNGADMKDTHKPNILAKKELDNVSKMDVAANADDKKKNISESSIVTGNGGTVTNGKRNTAINNASVNSTTRVNINKQCNDTESRGLGYNKSGSIVTSNNPAKMDVYTFSNDPPVVPAGAVKRKCPPGLPIIDIKRRKQQVQPQKKQTTPPQNIVKSPRKTPTESPVPAKRPVSIAPEPGPSRTPTASNTKPPSGPMLSNDTRNLLDGCGLNIPASLSITLTAPKSPGNSSSFVESNETKDNRKGMLGKVSPSITLNDRSVDPRVLKALKAGQIRMPAPAKPVRQAKQPEREVSQQRQTTPGKRKRDQESRDILDLSGGKKMDIHPLRIPQPVAKLKPKPSPREHLPNISEQGQIVTLMGGHRYYRAPPGSLTPAAHRVTDCPIPTPTRTPVYAPGLSSSLNGNRSNANLSSVFPSLQSLYALSQAPNLQQFQMDTRLRLSRGYEGNPSTTASTESRTTSTNVVGKTHLAAQCAPVKPARSSIAPLAVPISKQQTSERSGVSTPLSRTPTTETKIPVFRNTETLDSSDAVQQSSVQAKSSPNAEPNSRYSPGSNANTVNCTSNEPQTPTEGNRETNSESSDESKKEEEIVPEEQHHREAASPRVSSTASPSPPPGDANTNTPTDENSSSHENNVANTTNESDNDVPATPSQSNNNTPPEVSSSKSPASPDSSSITIESPSSKSCPTIEQGLSSPTQTDTVKSLESSTKAENCITEEAQSDAEKTNTVSLKSGETKQMTSEIFQKRFLAAFPSNEWANNPIAAEHLGNFLKSLNASMKSEGKLETASLEKVESQSACNEAVLVSNEASSKTRTDVSE